MILRSFIILLLGLCFSTAWAQPDCVDSRQCRSQLLRVEISNSILNNNARSLLPTLQNFAASNTLPSLLEKSFSLQPLGFPQNEESCRHEKSVGNPLFADIDCSTPGLCGRSDIAPEARSAMCFNLPCPVFEGTLNAGKCDSQTNIFPNQISFPTPVNVNRIRMTPTSVQFENGRAQLCFRVTELALDMSVRLGLDTRGTRLPDNGFSVSHISPTLDGPRDICIAANVNLGSPSPVSHITITTPDNTPFISDNMIRAASQQLQISGLSGYPADQLQRVQGEIVPVIFQPIRATVENAVKTSLSSVFEREINNLAGQMSGTGSHLVNSQDLASEFGLANLAVRDQVAITECALLRGAGRPIPPTHPCVGLSSYGTPITPENFHGPAINELMTLQYVAGDLPITSENLKQRLLAMRELILNQRNEFARPDDPPHFAQGWREAREDEVREYIDPLVDRISRNQLNSQIFNFVEIQNQLQSGSASRNVGVSVPEICSDRNPSPHARREIPNCPVQAYIDLNEMNQVLDRMWNAGRLCQRGRGPFVPTMQNGSPQYDEEGKPIGSGCYFEVEGLGCYLNNAPHITYDQRTRKYKTHVNLRGCYRGPAFLGLGRIGGDFNIDFSFTPKACNGGDFCMDHPDASWSVVPGSERFAMRPDSMLHGIVTDKINDAMNGAIGNTIRIPMASGVGPLANVPLEAEGRVDTGPGFFGACLRLRGSGSNSSSSASSSGVSGQ